MKRKLESYQTDEERNPVWFHKPEVVVFPETTEQVAEIVKLANTYLIPITPVLAQQTSAVRQFLFMAASFSRWTG